MANHTSILAWRIPWTEEPGRLESMELQRVGQERVIFTFTSFKETLKDKFGCFLFVCLDFQLDFLKNTRFPMCHTCAQSTLLLWWQISSKSLTVRPVKLCEFNLPHLNKQHTRSKVPQTGISTNHFSRHFYRYVFPDLFLFYT